MAAWKGLSGDEQSVSPDTTLHYICSSMASQVALTTDIVAVCTSRQCIDLLQSLHVVVEASTAFWQASGVQCSKALCVLRLPMGISGNSTSTMVISFWHKDFQWNKAIRQAPHCMTPSKCYATTSGVPGPGMQLTPQQHIVDAALASLVHLV